MLFSIAGSSVGELSFLQLNSWKTVLISSVEVNQGLPIDLRPEVSSRAQSLTKRNVTGSQESPGKSGHCLGWPEWTLWRIQYFVPLILGLAAPPLRVEGPRKHKGHGACSPPFLQVPVNMFHL